MELDGCLWRSQEPITALYPDPDKSSSQPHISVKTHLILSCSLLLGLLRSVHLATLIFIDTYTFQFLATFKTAKAAFTPNSFLTYTFIYTFFNYGI
jgi:hypothetical protein